MLRTTDEAIFARITAVFEESVEERAALPFMPIVLLLRIRNMIWNPPDGASWDGAPIAKQTLLGRIVADFIGMDAPEHAENAGNAMDHDLGENGRRGTWLDDLTKKRNALNEKGRRQAKRARRGGAADGAAGGEAAAGGAAEIPSPPDEAELLELQQ